MDFAQEHDAKALKQPLMAELYYCVKCRRKTEIKDAKPVTMKNGKPALRGACTVCGTTVNAILSAKKAS